MIAADAEERAVEVSIARHQAPPVIGVFGVITGNASFINRDWQLSGILRKLFFLPYFFAGQTFLCRKNA